MTATECVICRSFCSRCEILVNGTSYHRACYEQLLRNLAEMQADVGRTELRLQSLASEMEWEKSIGAKVGRFLSGASARTPAILEAQAAVRDHLVSSSKQIEVVRGKVRALYDFWPTYPPDWEERRDSVVRAAGFRCRKCHAYNQFLHAHHKLPIAKGGDHRLQNLEPLCKECHEKRHGSRSFGAKKVAEPSAYSETLAFLEEAISARRTVRFQYQKRDGERSVRTIDPQGFKTVEHTLCVFGFCHLRRAERTFAIRRMTQLQKVPRL